MVVDYRYPRSLVPATGQGVGREDGPIRRAPGRADAICVQFRRVQRRDGTGFVEEDHVSPEEQVRRYLQGRQDIPARPPTSPSHCSEGTSESKPPPNVDL